MFFIDHIEVLSENVPIVKQPLSEARHISFQRHDFQLNKDFPSQFCIFYCKIT